MPLLDSTADIIADLRRQAAPAESDHSVYPNLDKIKLREAADRMEELANSVRVLGGHAQLAALDYTDLIRALSAAESERDHLGEKLNRIREAIEE